MLRLRRAGAYVRLLIILLLPFACGLARAGCIESPDPAISRLQALAIADPHKALAGAQAMLGRSNHVGLLSEDLHVASGELWGNFPQTYSMVGVINGAVRLSSRWDTVV